MKNLVVILFSSILLVSCKTMQTASNLDRNGFEVVYVGHDPNESPYEKYPVKDSDSLEFHYDLESKQNRIYVVEETRYVVLNESFELLWIESK